MKTYQQKKEKARSEAIEWQHFFQTIVNNDMQKVIFWEEHFQKLGKKYGLLKEFRENGII